MIIRHRKRPVHVRSKRPVIAQIIQANSQSTYKNTEDVVTVIQLIFPAMQEFTLHRNSIPRRPLLPPQRKLNMQLHAKLESRKKKLQLGLEDAVREKIRMPARDLKTTLAHSSKILEHFYPHHVTNRQGLSLDEFFER